MDSSQEWRIYNALCKASNLARQQDRILSTAQINDIMREYKLLEEN